MPLKGERKRDWQRTYMKPYMKRRRAPQTTAEINRRLEELGIRQPMPDGKKAHGPVILSLSDARTARQLDRLCYEEWRRTG